MLEHIKDFLYDISDIVLSLVIIALIFFAVSWKISDSLSVDFSQSNPVQGADVIDSDTGSQVIDIIPDGSIPPSDNDPLGLDDEDDINPSDSQPDETHTPPDASNDNNDSDASPATAPNTPSGELKTFVVPSGASGYSIGKDLVSQGYIDDENAFVNRLVERDLDRKLFAGEFKLSPSDDLDTIINILTGQNR